MMAAPSENVGLSNLVTEILPPFGKQIYLIFDTSSNYNTILYTKLYCKIKITDNIFFTTPSTWVVNERAWQNTEHYDYEKLKI